MNTVNANNLVNEANLHGRTMRAVQFGDYGGPEVLKVAVVDRPSAGINRVLVRVEAAGVNRHDLYTRAGALKLITGRRFPLGTGIEFAGRIAESAVPELPVGTAVWGSVPAMKPGTTGAAAEYVAVDADRVSATPAGLSMVDAASLVVTATTAIRALIDIAALVRGERILIRGAAGGVGLAAVQIAIERGAEVTTLSGGRDIELLRKLGVTTALDYSQTTPGALGRFDVVFDTVGTQLLAYRRRLAKGGRMVTIAATSLAPFIAIGVSTIFGVSRIHTFSSDAHRELLDAAADLVTRSGLRADVAATFPLESIADAHRDLAAGGKRGKRVLVVE